MKRTLAILLACMMLFSCLSIAAAEDKPTLTVWIPVYQFGDGPDDLTFWNEHLADFAAANNCEIIVEIKPWTDYYTAAYTALAGTDGPDVVYGPTYDFMANNLLLPLNDYFTEEEIDNYLYWNTGLQMGGKQYCVPMMVGNARVMFYNMDILKASGITELPATWDDFIEMCKTIKATQPDVKPFLQNWGASTGTAALPAQDLSQSCKSRQFILEPGCLHLDLGLSGPGPGGKNLQNQIGTINHRPLNNLIEVAQLHGRQRVVKDHHVCFQHMGDSLDLLYLTFSHIDACVDLSHILGLYSHNLHVTGLGQTGKLNES